MGLGTKKESAWFFFSTPSYSPIILFYSVTITYSQPVNYFTHKKRGSFVNVDHDLKTKKPFQISDAQFKKYPDQGIVSVQLKGIKHNFFKPFFLKKLEAQSCNL